jgi:hypothetical protein
MLSCGLPKRLIQTIIRGRPKFGVPLICADREMGQSSEWECGDRIYLMISRTPKLGKMGVCHRVPTGSRGSPICERGIHA